MAFGPLQGLAGTGAGNILTGVGTALGLPGAGISENAGAGSLNPIGPFSQMSGLTNLATNGGNGYNSQTSSTNNGGGGGGGGGGSYGGGGNVLGVSTSTGGGTKTNTNSNYQIGGWYNGRQWDGSQFGSPGQTIVGATNNAPSNQGPQNNTPNLDAIYEPYYNDLNNITNSLNQQYKGQGGLLDTINQQYTGSQGKIQGEQSDLSNQLDQQNQQLQKGTSSAYDQARDMLNGLVQQGMSRFGAGSSLGGAVGELSNQEYLKDIGNIQGQDLQGQQQIQNQRNQLQQYISGKMSELDNWKQSSMLQANTDLQNALDNINSQRGMIDSEKAQAKQDALQSAMQQAYKIQSDAKDYANSLNAWGLQQNAQVQQRSFTPQDIANYTNQMSQTVPASQTQTQIAPLASQLAALMGGNPQDYMQSLTGGTLQPQAPTNIGGNGR